MTNDTQAVQTSAQAAAAQQSKALTPVDAIRRELGLMKGQLEAALPKHVDAEKFIRVAVTSLQLNPALVDCSRQSLFGAWMKSAQCGLLPDGKEAAIVPYNGAATFQPMVGGLMKLVRNSGEIATWSIRVVKENDFFDYQLGDDERISHKPALKDRGKTVGAYSIVTLKSGEKSREFMDIDELQAIRARSRAKDSGPWKTDTDEMYKKTVAKRHYKVLPSSTDNDPLAKAIESDDDVIETTATAIQDQEQTPTTEKKSRLTKVIESSKPVETRALTANVEAAPDEAARVTVL